MPKPIPSLATAMLKRRIIKITTMSSMPNSFNRSLCNISTAREESYDDRNKAYPTLLKLAHVLKHVDDIDGRVVNFQDGSTVTDLDVVEQLQRFKSIARAFTHHQENGPMTLDSLTKVCNFLHVSVQQRKSIRLTLCRQITQQHIWRGALQELLESLVSEMCVLKDCNPSSFNLAKQIVSACLKLLTNDSTHSKKDATPLWMQLTYPTTKKASSVRAPPCKWEEVLEMFNDLTECLSKEEPLASHLLKVNTMKEGLYQIRDVVLEREIQIGYKEVRQQDYLVQKKLTMSLGHSSKCLFALLLYYLYGDSRDISMEVSQLHGSVTGGKGVLCVGKMLTSDDEKMVLAGVKQLDRAIGLFKIVWETAELKGVLELQGHLWCIGVKERRFKYRGNMFFLHAFKL